MRRTGQTACPCFADAALRWRPTASKVTLMWILLACGSAFFAGLTAVLAKLGIRHTDSTVATALRTIVVLAAAWLMVLIVGSQDQVARIDGRTFVFLVLSGLATGASWLCYFRALQLGDVSRVVPVDKLSTVLTVILAVLLLGESLTRVGLGGVVLMTTGTFLMLDAADLRALPRAVAHGGGWLPWALGSAVFAALTAVLGKIGITDVESNLGTAVRTGVVLVMAWMMVLVTGKRERVRRVPRDELRLDRRLRFGHRRLLAVLLQRPPEGAGQPRRPDRQAERPSHGRLLRHRAARAPGETLLDRARTARHRHCAHGGRLIGRRRAGWNRRASRLTAAVLGRDVGHR